MLVLVVAHAERVDCLRNAFTHVHDMRWLRFVARPCCVGRR